MPCWSVHYFVLAVMQRALAHAAGLCDQGAETLQTRRGRGGCFPRPSSIVFYSSHHGSSGLTGGQVTLEMSHSPPLSTFLMKSQVDFAFYPPVPAVPPDSPLDFSSLILIRFSIVPQVNFPLPSPPSLSPPLEGRATRATRRYDKRTKLR